MIVVLGVLAWLAGTLRWLARYPGIPAAPAERLSLRVARVGLGALLGLAYDRELLRGSLQQVRQCELCRTIET